MAAGPEKGFAKGLRGEEEGQIGEGSADAEEGFADAEEGFADAVEDDEEGSGGDAEEGDDFRDREADWNWAHGKEGDEFADAEESSTEDEAEGREDDAVALAMRKPAAEEPSEPDWDADDDQFVDAEACRLLEEDGVELARKENVGLVTGPLAGAPPNPHATHGVKCVKVAHNDPRFPDRIQVWESGAPCLCQFSRLTVTPHARGSAALRASRGGTTPPLPTPPLPTCSSHLGTAPPPQ